MKPQTNRKAGAPKTRADGHGRAGEFQSVFESVSEEKIRDLLLGERWFRSKGEKIRKISAFDGTHAQWKGREYFFFFLRVQYEARDHEIYFLPFRIEGEKADAGEGRALLHAEAGGRKYVFFDAFHDPEFNLELFLHVCGARTIATRQGTVEFHREAALEAGEGTEVRKMRGEQSNTSLDVGGDYMLKVFRKIDMEINPEAEMLRFLTRRGFKNIPQFRGDAVYRFDEKRESTFAILVDFVKSESDGWKYALECLKDYYGRFAGKKPAETDIGEYLESSLGRFRELGRVTAGLHQALASDEGDPAFSPEPVAEKDILAWIQACAAQLARVRRAAESAAANPRLPEAARDGCRRFLDAGPELLARADRLRMIPPGSLKKIRYHGDYHLGQVLRGADRWYITDFEGEPIRPIAERKQKTCPLKDVAGMLRSFSYAAFVSERESGVGKDPAWIAKLRDRWVSAAREAFLEAYFGDLESSSSGLFSLDAGQRTTILGFFELEKAVYELYYEMNNRPEWIEVPLAGIEKLLRE